MSDHDSSSVAGNSTTIVHSPRNNKNKNKNKNKSYRPWTREEIEDLNYMSTHYHTVNEISRELERPRKDIIRALKRVQQQQTLFHTIDEVAFMHDIQHDKLVSHLKDPLYYVPIKSPAVPGALLVSVAVFGIVSLYGYLCFVP